MLYRIICLLIGYCCGLFQTSYIYGRMKHIDIREHGIGNAGTTNALRTLGKKAGAITFAGDILKPMFAMLLAWLFFHNGQEDGIYTLVLENGTTIEAEIYNFRENVEYTENPVLCDDINDTKMCIVRYEENLIINEGVVLTPQVRKKGFLVFVGGTLYNNGTISMTGKGAAAEGQDVLLYKNADNDYEYVPAVGGTGGSSLTISGNSKSLTGRTGNIGERRSTAGGGTGAVAACNNRTEAPKYTVSSTGGTGTSYSGGAGSGGTSRHSQGGGMTLNQPDKYIGGKGSLADGSFYAYKSCAGGGAGIEGGKGVKSSSAKSTEDGQTGTGGLLIIYTDALSLSSTSKFTSEGLNGGGCVAGGGSGTTGSAAAGGGGSGGGSINIFANQINDNNIDMNSIYSTIGGSGGIGSGGTSGANGKGGQGGTGSFTIGTISKEGVYTDYSLENMQ